LGFFLLAKYQYGNIVRTSFIPRVIIIDDFIDRGGANPSPPRSYTYYEIKYGEPDISNVSDYWIDDETTTATTEKEKPSGKERQQQQELERERDYSDRFYGPDENYIDELELLSGYDQYY